MRVPGTRELLQRVCLCGIMPLCLYQGAGCQAHTVCHIAAQSAGCFLQCTELFVQVKLEKEVTAMAARQLEASAASIQKLLGVAAKFAAETFVPFEQGGRLAPDSITRFQQQLAQLEAAIEDTRCGRHHRGVSSGGTAWMPWRLHMVSDTVCMHCWRLRSWPCQLCTRWSSPMQCLQLAAVYRVKQQGHVEAAQRAVLQRADVALSDLVAALPPHRRDLALIEALNRAIGRPFHAYEARLLAPAPPHLSLATRVL